MKDEVGDPSSSCASFEDAMGDYVDGALAGEARQGLERHLASCTRCRALAGDLRAIRRTAGTLDRRVPPRAVWERVQAQIAAARTAPPATTRRWVMPLAAAAVLTLAVGAGFYARGRVGTRGPAPAPAIQAHDDAPSAPATTTTPVAREELARSVEAEMQMAEQHYEKAIAGLEQIAKSEESTLDPQLAATLRKNLGVIDQAISESRAALKAQPDSEPAQESLFEAFRDKLTVLQDTITLINEMRKGNQAEAARIVGGMNKM